MKNFFKLMIYYLNSWLNFTIPGNSDNITSNCDTVVSNPTFKCQIMKKTYIRQCLCHFQIIHASEGLHLIFFLGSLLKMIMVVNMIILKLQSIKSQLFKKTKHYKFLHRSLESQGRYFRNFWVEICHWDPGTLSLYQS